MEMEIEFVPDFGQDMLEFANYTQLYSALTSIRREVAEGGMSRSTAVGLESACPGILEGHRPSSFTELGSSTKLVVALEAIDWKRGALFGGAVIVILTVLFKFLSWLHEVVFGRKKGEAKSYDELKKKAEQLREETLKRVIEVQERHKPLFNNPDANRIMDGSMLSSSDARVQASSLVIASHLENGKIASYREAERRMSSLQACIMRTKVGTDDQMNMQALLFAGIAASPNEKFIPGALRLCPDVDSSKKINLGPELYATYHVFMTVLQKVIPSFEEIIAAAKSNDLDRMKVCVLGAKTLGGEFGATIKRYPKYFTILPPKMRVETGGIAEYNAVANDDFAEWTTYVDKICATKYTINNEDITRGMAPLDNALDVIYSITEKRTYDRMAEFYKQVDRGMKDATADALANHRKVLDDLERTISTLEQNRRRLLSDKDSPLRVQLSPPQGYEPPGGVRTVSFNAPDSGLDALEFLMSIARGALELIKPINRAGIGYSMAYERIVKLMTVKPT